VSGLRLKEERVAAHVLRLIQGLQHGEAARMKFTRIGDKVLVRWRKVIDKPPSQGET
jgi:hypothetical protein